ncbi:MAG TPA: aldolase/citrate lyase family protein, partial [Propionibacteriaceae bacterium]|nr:aldolase/citrate lyase family protein [Propionibacteriaceae bacterium]
DAVDVLFVGPRDLSHDLGVPGDVQAPRYLEALDRVRGAAQRSGKSCGLLVPSGAAAAEKRAEGWTFVGVGSDSTLLATALTAELASARSNAR